MTCSSCAFENRPLARFCGRCGAALPAPVPCPRCGAPNAAPHAYCDACGERLTAAGDMPATREQAADSGAPPQTIMRRADASDVAVMVGAGSAPVVGAGPIPVVGAGPAGASAPGADDRSADGDTAPVGLPPVGGPAAVGPRPDAEGPDPDAPVNGVSTEAAAPAAASDVPPAGRAGGTARRPVRLTEQQARTMTLGSLALAAVGELSLQLTDATPAGRTLGVAALLLAAVLAALGAGRRALPTDLDASSLSGVGPRAAFGDQTDRIAGAVGGLVFATLLLRLWFGSVAWSDLLLWTAAIVTAGLPFVRRRLSWRPSRPALAEAWVVGAVVVLFVLLNARDVNDWYYSAVSDSYAFWNAANGTLVDGVQRPFAHDGVYGVEPMLGVVYQAAVMWAAGRSHAGWVLSSILSAAVAIPALYLIGRALGGPVLGLIAASLFASSHYVFAFAHLGYTNVAAPTPVAWAVALFLLGVRRRSAALLYGAGLAAGLGFYGLYTGRVAVVVLLVAAVAQVGWQTFTSPRLLQDRLAALWPVLLGFALAIGPIVAANGTAVLVAMFGRAPASPAPAVGAPLGQRLAAALAVDLPAFFGGSVVSHFTSGSLLDPLTAALAALGIGLAVRWRANLGAKLLLTWAVVGVAVAGPLSQHAMAPITRMHIVVPPLAVLAALAAVHAWTRLGPDLRSLDRTRVAFAGVGVLLLSVLGLNLHRFWVVTPSRLRSNQESVVMRALQSDACGPDLARTVVVMRNFSLVRLSLLTRGAERSLPRMVSHNELQANQPLAVDGMSCVVFGDPDDDVARRQLDALAVGRAGAEVRQVRDLTGQSYVIVFRPPGAPR